MSTCHLCKNSIKAGGGRDRALNRVFCGTACQQQHYMSLVQGQEKRPREDAPAPQITAKYLIIITKETGADIGVYNIALWSPAQLDMLSQWLNDTNEDRRHRRFFDWLFRSAQKPETTETIMIDTLNEFTNKHHCIMYAD